MASLTRSERRPDDCSPHAHHRFLSSPRHQRNSGPLVSSSPRPRPTIFHQQQQHHVSSSGRTKRGLDVANERDIEALKPKRARIAVEILAKAQRPPPITSDAVRAGGGAQQPQQQQHQHQARLRVSGGVVGIETVVKPPQLPPQQHRKSTTAAPTPKASAATPNAGATTAVSTTAKQQRQRQQQQQIAPAQPTKHQEKVRKGIQHELDRLKPQSADKAAEPSGRKLRSQEATRFKSELSAYFPDYDEVVGNDPKEQHLLNIDTPIVVVDTARDASTSHLDASGQYPVHGYGDALFAEIFDAQRIDFSFLESQFKNKALEDPLPDSSFEGVHKRAERLERSIRNTEKGRAQHEKDQIIRLLEGLQGHDWLRVMGISGITDSRKKSFEPAREHFIRGCQAIIDKFRNWTIEEKRRKAEKDRAVAEEAERAAGEEEDTLDRKSEARPSQASSVADGDNSSLAASSDVSSPAKQLREEALAASRALARGLKRPRPAPKPPAATATPEPPKEFKSFFSKKYERDGALNKHRRAGRKVLAWGLPVPDMGEREFDLPAHLRDEETMRVRARKKRKEKRSSRV